jgi:Co/Zn/Cd efflux system component
MINGRLLQGHHRIFHVVMGINVGMFLLESVAGILSYSIALLADPLPIGRLRHRT